MEPMRSTLAGSFTDSGRPLLAGAVRGVPVEDLVGGDRRRSRRRASRHAAHVVRRVAHGAFRHRRSSSTRQCRSAPMLPPARPALTGRASRAGGPASPPGVREPWRAFRRSSPVSAGSRNAVGRERHQRDVAQPRRDRGRRHATQPALLDDLLLGPHPGHVAVERRPPRRPRPPSAPGRTCSQRKRPSPLMQGHVRP